MLITSPQNPRVKALIALRERKERQRTGLFVVEGHDEIALVLRAGGPITALYTCPALHRDPARADLVRRAADSGAEITELGEAAFAKAAYRENPDGFLATFRAPPADLAHLAPPPPALILICEAVEKPGNLGAMLRTADAAGVGAVIACDPLTDWGNPNVVRASKGALFSVPTAAASSAETIRWLRERGIQIVVTTPAATRPYTDHDLRGPVAIAVGAEDEGLSDVWLAAAESAVVIPMFGAVNSLNVATSAALLVYEAVRQRGGTGRGG